MKGRIALCTIAILATLVVVGVALAADPLPPICAEGQITVTPAVWVLEVPAVTHEEYRVWIPAVTTCPTATFSDSRVVVDVPAHTEHRTWWHDWQDGNCRGHLICETRTVPAVTHIETFGPITFQYHRSQDPNSCHRPLRSELDIPSWTDYNTTVDEHLPAIVVTPGAWGPWTLIVCHGQGCENRTVTDSPYVPGYWTPPVCREPVVTHDVDCEGVRELVEGVFVRYIYHWADAYVTEAWQDYNEPAGCLVVHCLQTIPGQAQNTVEGPWTAWTYDPTSGQEFRTRVVTTYSEPRLDALDPTFVCTPSVPRTTTETQWQDYAACQDGLIATPGEWSAWAFDPQRQVMFRTRSVIYTDALSEAQCGDPVIEETTEGQPACQWNGLIPATDDACQPQYCTFSVVTYWRCNTGNVIWSQETGVTSGEGSNFIGAAPYNRICEWCGDITPGVYHREWRSDCDGSGWDEGTWELPEWLHTLGGCPLGGRCTG